MVVEVEPSAFLHRGAGAEQHRDSRRRPLDPTVTVCSAPLAAEADAGPVAGTVM